MTYVVQAIYEDGVLKPLEKLDLIEHQQVQVIVESTHRDEVSKTENREPKDPLDGIRVATGIRDLAEHFDENKQGFGD